jgi:argininosuccinate synthase
MKIVVAYSGGLDTSVLLLWLKEKYNAEIIAYCADVGQAEELDGLEEKALSTGASKCYIGDLKEEFAADYIYPMFQANAVYEGRYLLGTSIARPCIIKGMLDVARAEGADAIAHGATGKGNDQVRFELSLNALAPDIKMIAPWRDDSFREQFPGRAEMIAYCEEHGINVQASNKKPYSMDRNLLHISFEAGALEDTWYDGSTDADKICTFFPSLPKTHPILPSISNASSKTATSSDSKMTVSPATSPNSLTSKSKARRTDTPSSPLMASCASLTTSVASTASAASTSSRTASSA